MYGFSGSHRTGKTTLAKALAEQMGIEFVETPTSAVFARLGKDPKVEYPIEERMDIQDAILDSFEVIYESKQGKSWVSDRTPLDTAMYTMADIQRTTLWGNSYVSDRVQAYVKRCLTMTRRYFWKVILVQPGIPLTEGVGKAPGCPSYMEHLNLLQYGLMNEMVQVYAKPALHTTFDVMPRHILDLDRRLIWVRLVLDGIEAEKTDPRLSIS